MNSLNHLIVLFKVYISFTYHHLKFIMHTITQLRMRYALVTHAFCMQLRNYARVVHALRMRYARVMHAITQLRMRYACNYVITHKLRTHYACNYASTHALRTHYARVMQAVPRAPTKLNRALGIRNCATPIFPPLASSVFRTHRVPPSACPRPEEVNLLRARFSFVGALGTACVTRA